MATNAELQAQIEELKTLIASTPKATPKRVAPADSPHRLSAPSKAIEALELTCGAEQTATEKRPHKSAKDVSKMRADKIACIAGEFGLKGMTAYLTGGDRGDGVVYKTIVDRATGKDSGLHLVSGSRRFLLAQAWLGHLKREGK